MEAEHLKTNDILAISKLEYCFDQNPISDNIKNDFISTDAALKEGCVRVDGLNRDSYDGCVRVNG